MAALAALTRTLVLTLSLNVTPARSPSIEPEQVTAAVSGGGGLSATEASMFAVRAGPHPRRKLTSPRTNPPKPQPQTLTPP